MASPFRVGATYYAHGYTERDDPGVWGHTTDGGRVYGITRARYAECDSYHCKPVVVIDPEDREQVERLDAAYQKAMDESPRYAGLHDVMAAALRSFVAPPPPEEPTNPSARVVDIDGLAWAKHEGAWLPLGSGKFGRFDWDHLCSTRGPLEVQA